MKIQVTEKEITAGLITYLKSRGFNDMDEANIQVEYTQGRKGSGLTATLVEGPAVTKAVTAVDGVEVVAFTDPVTPGVTGQAEAKPEVVADPEPTPELVQAADPAPDTQAAPTQASASSLFN